MQDPGNYVLSIRGNYTLAGWGEVFKYSLDDWKQVIDAMAEDGHNIIFFWLSGLFRSAKYPESLFYPQVNLSDDDIRALIDHSHQRGIKFCITFGVFGWFGIDKIAEANPSTRASEMRGMCPSNQLAREINREYGLEMLERFPAIDGFSLELRDEYGPCFCDTCQQPLDEYGSRQYGQSELTWIREFAQELWKRRPEAMVCVPIGYDEKGCHDNDVLFYEGIKSFEDERVFWLVVRDNRELPGAGGRTYPLEYFSKQMLHWSKYYLLTPQQIGEWVASAFKSGCAGACPAFEPGLNSASFYSYDRPFPVDALPYRLTRFAFQQYCKNPLLEFQELKAAMRQEFLNPESDPSIVDDIMLLSRLIQYACGRREARVGRTWRSGWLKHWVQRAVKSSANDRMLADVWELVYAASFFCRQIGSEHAAIMDSIEEKLPSLEAAGGRSAKTAAMLRKAITDIRSELMMAPKDAQLLDRARKSIQAKLDYLNLDD